MVRSFIFDVPSPSYSSSSSSPSRVHQTTENEGHENRAAKLSDRNDKIVNLEFEKLEQLEREVLRLMVAKGLKGENLKNLLGEKGMKLNKLKDLGIGMEEEPKRFEKGKGRVKVYDKKLREEIELLESMLERGSYGLVDLQMMMEEVKGLEGSEEMVSEIKMKISELESELCELKNAIVELKGKKSKELMMGCVKIEEEYEGLKCEEQEYNDDDDEEEEEDNVSKIKWGSIFASVGAVAVAATAVFLMGQSSVEVKSERKNRDQTG